MSRNVEETKVVKKKFFIVINKINFLTNNLELIKGNTLIIN